MSLLGAAAEVLFNDAAGAVVDATYIAPPARVSPSASSSRRDPLIDFSGFQSQARSPSWEAHLHQTEVATRPRPTIDQLVVNRTTYTISDVIEDVEQTEWVCDLGG